MPKSGIATSPIALDPQRPNTNHPTETVLAAASQGGGRSVILGNGYACRLATSGRPVARQIAGVIGGHCGKCSRQLDHGESDLPWAKHQISDSPCPHPAGASHGVRQPIFSGRSAACQEQLVASMGQRSPNECNKPVRRGCSTSAAVFMSGGVPSSSSCCASPLHAPRFAPGTSGKGCSRSKERRNGTLFAKKCVLGPRVRLA